MNPATAERDLDIPVVLQKAFGHNHLGVYAEVLEDGFVMAGNLIV